jgi:hypothetical protein
VFCWAVCCRSHHSGCTCRTLLPRTPFCRATAAYAPGFAPTLKPWLQGSEPCTSLLLYPCSCCRYWELSDTSSCFLQRHPLLGSHDRLIRIPLDKSALAAASAVLSRAGGSSSSSSVRERKRVGEARALLAALDDVLTHGVMLAGRRYRRCVSFKKLVCVLGLVCRMPLSADSCCDAGRQALQGVGQTTSSVFHMLLCDVFMHLMSC